MTLCISTVPGSQWVSFEHELFTLCFSPQHSSEFWCRACRQNSVHRLTDQCNLNRARISPLAGAASVFYLCHRCLGSDKDHSCSQDQKEWQSHHRTLKDQTDLNWTRTHCRTHTFTHSVLQESRTIKQNIIWLIRITRKIQIVSGNFLSWGICCLLTK